MRGLRFHLVLDGHGKECSEDHIGSGVGGPGIQGHLPGREPIASRFGRGQHGRKAHPQARGIEGRRDDPALAFPKRTIGHEQPVAQQEPQPLGHLLGFQKIAGAFVQHQPQKLGVVHKVGPEKRRFELGHPSPVKPLGLGRKDVLTKELEIAPKRDVARAGWRLGWDHGAIVRKPEAGRVMRLADEPRELMRAASVCGPAVIRK